MKKTIILIITHLLVAAYTLQGQEKVIVKSDLFLIGADSLPTDNLQGDTLFYFNQQTGSMQVGVFGTAGSNPYIDSIGDYAAGIGYEVFPLGDKTIARQVRCFIYCQIRYVQNPLKITLLGEFIHISNL